MLILINLCNKPRRYVVSKAFSISKSTATIDLLDMLLLKFMVTWSIYNECHLLGYYATWLLRTEISEECIAPIIRVIRIGKLGMLAVTSN
jgi:hypothetical protein